MSYKDWTIEQVISSGFMIEVREGVFTPVRSVISERLKEEIEQLKLGAYDTSTEMGVMEFIITPILKDVVKITKNLVSIFVGKTFNIDTSRDLVGQPDYILGGRVMDVVTAPVVIVAEAKNGDLNKGFAQCMAEMIAAQIFNERKGVQKTIYGVVSGGDLWAFMKLEGNKFSVEQDKYQFRGNEEAEILVGIIVSMIEEFFE